MQRNQIFLDDRPLRQNKAFLRALYNADLEEANRWFDEKENSVTREPDTDMTLDIFLNQMDKSYYTVLQMGSPDANRIRYCARRMRGIDRFAWVECPYNEVNYGIVATLFEKTFKERIESIPVPDYLKNYHREMGML